MTINTRLAATLSLLLTLAASCCLGLDEPQSNDRLATFVQQLGSDDSDSRKAAIDEVYKLGPKIIPYLVDRLSDSDVSVTVGLGMALERFGTGAVPELVKAVKSDDTGKIRKVLWVLGRLGSKSRSAVPELKKLMSHPDQRVREALMSAFGDINDAAALPLMLRAADSDPEVGVRISALSNMTTFSKDVLKQHIAELIAIGTSTKGDSHETVMNMAFVVLSEVGSDAIPHLAKIIDDRSFSEIARSRAIGCICNMAESATLRQDASAAIPCLIRVLRQPKSALRPTAARALGLMGKSAGLAIPWLEALVKGPLDSDRVEFAGAILQIDGSNEIALDALLKAAEQKDDRQLRSYSLQRLRVGSSVPSKAAPTLVKLLGDSDPMVRRMVISLLGDLSDKDGKIESQLRKVATSDSDSEVRSAAQDSIRRLDTRKRPD